jgi:ABC-2 type transport system permease protein
MLFAVLAKKAYARNLQYRFAHMVNNVASSIFGFVYVSIWAGIGAGSSLGEYGVRGMTSYIAFNQACLWIVMFVTNGLGLEQSVRTGQIALDLMRPVNLFVQLMSREWGQVAYQFLYKFLPIYFLYFFVFSIHTPVKLSVYGWTAVSLALAAYISICINYLIGAAAVWTTESRWLYWVNYAFSMLLSGFFIPIEWLPKWLHAISVFSPYPYIQYHPTRIYLEYEQGSVLEGSVLWCLAMTLACLFVTRLMRHKLEVQGG